LIHVDDAARIVLAAECEAAAGRTYCICDGQPTRRRAYYAHLAELLGTEPPRYEEEAIANAARPNARGAGSKLVSNRRMRDELAIELAYPSFREGLSAIVAGQRESEEC
jgi:nucleoside-diphosphate-sugar epimerase